MYTVKSLEWANQYVPMVKTCLLGKFEVSMEIRRIYVLDELTVRMEIQTFYPATLSDEDERELLNWIETKFAKLTPDVTTRIWGGSDASSRHELKFYPVPGVQLEYTMMEKSLAFTGGQPAEYTRIPRLVTESFCGKSSKHNNCPFPKPWGTRLQEKVLEKKEKAVKQHRPH